MQHINIMLKPVSGLCNMRCKYCFYADETKKRAIANYGLMSFDTLHSVLEKFYRKQLGHARLHSRAGNQHWRVCHSFGRQSASVKEKM